MGIDQPILLDLPAEWAGERIVLRRWRDGDAAALFAAIVASGEHLARWFPWPAEHRVADDTLGFIRRQSGHWSLRQHAALGIFRRAEGALVGSLGVTARDWSVPAFELGYWVGREAEGRGYVSEAVRVMARFLFEELRAERVVIRCDARNVRSKAVPERLGFAFEGTLRRDSRAPDGTIRDTLVYAMVPADYERAKMTWPSVGTPDTP
jgi:RimJ/RimL family protein N-acetyltransferase